MTKGFLRRITVKSAAAYILTTAAVEFLLSEKFRKGVKKGYVTSRDYVKHLAAECAAAYKKGKKSIIYHK